MSTEKESLSSATSRTQSSSSIKDGRKSSPVKDAVAGALAGAVTKTIVAPVERVKLLMQLQGSIKNSSNTLVEAAEGSTKLGPFQVAKNVYYKEGLLSFWRGNTPNVIQMAGASALNFMLMDHYKHLVRSFVAYHEIDSGISSSEKLKKLGPPFLSGGLAGGTTTTVLYPLQFLRTRLAMDVGAKPEARKYPRGMSDALLVTMKTDGIKGLYQGYGIALFGVVLYRALHLGGYDILKSESLLWMKRMNPSNTYGNVELTMFHKFILAQSISVLAAFICYPIDSVKRRLMMQSGNPITERQYRNSIDCFQKVLRQEGIRGYYLGFGPNLIRTLGNALLLVGYDFFKGLFS